VFLYQTRYRLHDPVTCQVCHGHFDLKLGPVTFSNTEIWYADPDDSNTQTVIDDTGPLFADCLGELSDDPFENDPPNLDQQPETTRRIVR
jgi:hypothetical protein